AGGAQLAQPAGHAQRGGGAAGGSLGAAARRLPRGPGAAALGGVEFSGRRPAHGPDGGGDQEVVDARLAAAAARPGSGVMHSSEGGRPADALASAEPAGADDPRLTAAPAAHPAARG